MIRHRPRPVRAAASRIVLALLPFVILASLLLGSLLLPAGESAAETTTSSYAGGHFQAPTRLFTVPNTSNLVSLPGDLVTMRYSLGALDRSARLQSQLQVAQRAFQRGIETPLAHPTVLVLTRDQWQEARLQMPYGIPVRVGQAGLAMPALGDDETARLWAELRVALPTTPNQSNQGADSHGPSVAMADVLGTLLLAEIQVDRARLAGDEYWVRGLMSHLVVVDYLQRGQESRLEDLDFLYGSMMNPRGKKALATSDYRPELSMSDWMWFQGALYFGARTLQQEEGRGIWRKLRKLRKRSEGVLTSAALLDHYDGLRAWHAETFAAFSTRPAN